MSKVIDLDVLQRFETHLGDLYGLFAEVLRDDREVSALFAKMALEEYGHAELVAYQRRILEQNPELFSDLDLDLDEVFQATARVRHVRERAPSLSATEAATRALEFESSAAEYHSRMAMLQANSGFAAFLNRLGHADHEHQERLETLIRSASSAAPSPGAR